MREEDARGDVQLEADRERGEREECLHSVSAVIRRESVLAIFLLKNSTLAHPRSRNSTLLGLTRRRHVRRVTLCGDLPQRFAAIRSESADERGFSGNAEQMDGGTFMKCKNNLSGFLWSRAHGTCLRRAQNNFERRTRCFGPLFNYLTSPFIQEVESRSDEAAASIRPQHQHD